MSDDFREGDFYRTDDRTGKKVRASDTRREWTGRFVHKDDWEPRHPQDFVRGLTDRQTVPNPRPVPIAQFVGPLTTTFAAAASAGATSLTVDSSVRFAAQDWLLITLNNGDTCRRRVQSVPDAEHILLLTPLPWAASIGNLIVNQTAVAPSNIT